MLIITALNITGESSDGTSDYRVWVGVNHYQIWAGQLDGHIRKEGAAALLRRIADAMESQKSDASGMSPVDA